MNNLKRHEIFKRLESQNPSPTTELNYTSSFELLVAVILSAQATDISVNKATGNSSSMLIHLKKSLKWVKLN